MVTLRGNHTVHNRDPQHPVVVTYLPIDFQAVTVGSPALRKAEVGVKLSVMTCGQRWQLAAPSCCHQRQELRIEHGASLCTTMGA